MKKLTVWTDHGFGISSLCGLGGWNVTVSCDLTEQEWCRGECSSFSNTVFNIMDKEELVCAWPSWAWAMPGHCNVSALYMCGESCSILHNAQCVHTEETTVQQSHVLTVSSFVTTAQNWSNTCSQKLSSIQHFSKSKPKQIVIKYLQSSFLLLLHS